MKREPVDSSNIASVGYDPATNTLEVEFQSGGIYEYSDVPADVHSALLEAKSKGHYIEEHIKGHYDYKQAGRSPR